MGGVERRKTMRTDEDNEVALDSIDFIFKAEGIEHFTAREVCSMRRAGNAIAIPPFKFWERIIPTLRLAEEIRSLIECPLQVGNGYRPRDYNKAVGGSMFSQHIQFRALDLDLPRSRRGIALQEELYETAAELFLSKGKELKMGLGLYRHNRGSRIHIDTGYGYRHWKKKFTKPLLERLR